MTTMAVEVPVLVVGAGPVGLMSAILLARHGVACRVIERRDTPREAPAAHVVNARTFEICRAAGVDMAAIEAACTPPADGGQVLWVTTLAGEELGRLPFERQGEDLSDVTPTPLRNLSQDRFEAILRDTLGRLGGRVAWGHAWESADADADGVTSRIRHARGVSEVRSRWVIAADGAGSPVRKSLGIEPIGPGRLQSFVMIHFEANLRPLVAHRPAVLYWTTAPGALGTFVAHDIDSTWVYMHPWDPDTEAAADYTEAACRGIVRGALGTDDVPLRIRTISTWTMTAQVAERYRQGRCFLAGDSAHRFPPTGGLGLNTGVQDAHNLAWKIAAVERGWAGDGLLDSYEAERRPVARANADASLRNVARLAEVYQALFAAEPGAAGGAGSPGDPAARAEVRRAIENQAEHFDMLGLQLGFAYESGALVPDGRARRAPADPIRDYLPAAAVGCRVPHAWVERRGRRVSTLDLLPLDRFTLVTTSDGGAWADAAAAIAGPPLHTLVIDRDLHDPGGTWARDLDLEPGGALLVRPDQHVAWRACVPPRDAAAVLRAAMAAIVATEAA